MTIHDLRNANVPLVLAPLDVSQKSAALWVKGDRPKDNVIAAVKLRPVEGVVVETEILPGQRPGKVVLILTLAGDNAEGAVVSDTASAQDKLFCAADCAPFRGRLLCLEDADKDGRFEGYGIASPQGRASVEQIAVVTAARPLPKPVAYRPARAEELPEFGANYVNCGKGYDEARYYLTAAPVLPSAAASSVDQLMEILAGRNPGIAGSIGLPSSQVCKRGEKLNPGEPHYPAGLGGGASAARLGDLVISIGPKEQGAQVRLHGLTATDRLYRFDGAKVRLIAEGPTVRQGELAVAQKFDKPVLVTTSAVKVHEGARTAGDVLLEVGFEHSYTGRLTVDTKISTLFSKRSLPKGTMLYGVPMTTRTVRVMTFNGAPITPFGGQPTGAPETVGLVWCAPVEEEGKWTATCLPWNQGSYTMLKGQTPAFEVKSLRYDPNSPNNAGAVPVLRQPADFGKPLSYRFRLKAVEAATLIVAQETLFGDSLVFSRDLRISRSSQGSSAIRFGGGAVHIEKGVTADAILVSQVGEFKPGAEAVFRTTPILSPPPIIRRSPSTPPPAPPKVTYNPGSATRG